MFRTVAFMYRKSLEEVRNYKFSDTKAMFDTFLYYRMERK